MVSVFARGIIRGIIPVLTVLLIVITSTITTHFSLRLLSSDNPLEGRSFYVDPISAAMNAAKANPDSPELAQIANTPQAYWLDQAFPPAVAARTVGRIVTDAQATDTMPILTLYGIPYRDCGSYAAGGFSSAQGYQNWIDSIAEGLGDAPATIILEPDALAMADCLSPEQRQERFNLMSYAVDTLNHDPAAVIYIDGGHSRWLSAETLASRLNQVGINKVRGFSLNTTNYYTTDEETNYGETVSGMTNGAHYVIDTSRNGLGPAPDSPLSWCNPPGRAIGTSPTTATSGQHADAYLWIKRVGESDGSCGRGEPPAGQFVSSYAIDLVRRAG